MASCDIRGSSPGSRELEVLDVARKLTEIHAVLLTGGSAFGLAAADGVMSWLAERDVGYRTPIAVVPIVPAAVVFDLGSGNPAARPDASAGRTACDAASASVATGAVGAGTGCTVGKWAGREFASPGGLGIAHASEAAWEASALAVVNAVGDVLADDGTVVAGTTASTKEYHPPLPEGAFDKENTVLAVVAVNAVLEKREVQWLAARGSDGITISVRPAHTRYDGDVVFAIAAPGPVAGPQDLDVLGHLATRAVAEAVRNAVRP
ncbi:MAG: hypothetical protein QOH90_1040 [Actinomycetota bacterium]|nr:hypothetical protein [Actinomycetota bacterium]